MMNPKMPNFAGGYPGVGGVTDTLEFVKNLWGGMGIPGLNVSGMNMPNIPGMVVPTFSVEELRKRISDLKAVETWLDLNMNMLRGTIQALEVQAATISTLQSMGEALSASVASAGGLGQSTQQAARESAPSSASAAGSTDARGATGAAGAAAPSEGGGKDGNAGPDAAALGAPLANAAAWWNMLQDQFRQAVNAAAMAADMSNEKQGENGVASAGAKPGSSADSGGAHDPEPAASSARKRKSSK